ncbi:hypothetical protein AB0N09_05705 [Streptomyces erythrochromogenes]|uniref:hypothetical protein n=1 Tax=Streptomyces erythrochromogenes TaxID=285574 RepID=UPI00342D2CE4
MTTTGQTATAHPRLTRYLDGYQHVIGADIPSGAAELVPALGRLHLHTDPFPFATVDDFLPEDLYRAILANWPSQSGFDQVARFVEGQPKGYLGNRKERVIENFAGNDAPMATETWNRSRLALRHPDFVRSLFQRFAGPLEEHLGLEQLRERDQPNFKLYANQDAGITEALGAHLDAAPKLLTIVVYLTLEGATDGSSREQWGTALYDCRPGERDYLDFSRNADHCLAHQVTFIPNRAFIMPNTAASLHGVAGGQPDVLRKTLMVGYWANK